MGGNGTVVFGNGNAGYNALRAVVGGMTLTLGPGITVHGQNGTIGDATALGGPGNVSVVNQGTISADVAGGTIVLDAQPFNNQGVMSAEIGTMQCSSSVLLSNGGLRVGINGANNNGQINFNSAVSFGGSFQAHINGGYVPNLGAAFTLLNYPSQNGVFAEISLPSQAQWQVSVGATSFAITATNLVVPPTITTQPATVTNNAVQTATFTVAATGTEPLTYQWQFNGTNLPNNIINTVAGNGSTAAPTMEAIPAMAARPPMPSFSPKAWR